MRLLELIDCIRSSWNDREDVQMGVGGEVVSLDMCHVGSCGYARHLVNFANEVVDVWIVRDTSLVRLEVHHINLTEEREGGGV